MLPTRIKVLPAAKYESLPKDIEWHFIGHLQTNKIKYIVPYVALIHVIDSYKLLAEVNKQAAKAGKTVNCLLQLHIAREETKFGFSFDECREMLAAGEWRELKHIRICGLMGMATNTELLTIMGFLSFSPAKVVSNVAMIMIFYG